jgi:hypothetical protein
LQLFLLNLLKNFKKYCISEFLFIKFVTDNAVETLF